MVGWIAVVASKSALVSPAFTAIAAACIISGASGAIMWMPTILPLSPSQTILNSERSLRPASTFFIGRMSDR